MRRFRSELKIDKVTVERLLTWRNNFKWIRWHLWEIEIDMSIGELTWRNKILCYAPKIKEQLKFSKKTPDYRLNWENCEICWCKAHTRSKDPKKSSSVYLTNVIPWVPSCSKWWPKTIECTELNATSKSRQQPSGEAAIELSSGCIVDDFC